MSVHSSKGRPALPQGAATRTLGYSVKVDMTFRQQNHAQAGPEAYLGAFQSCRGLDGLGKLLKSIL